MFDLIPDSFVMLEKRHHYGEHKEPIGYAETATHKFAKESRSRPPS